VFGWLVWLIERGERERETGESRLRIRCLRPGFFLVRYLRFASFFRTGRLIIRHVLWILAWGLFAYDTIFLVVECMGAAAQTQGRNIKETICLFCRGVWIVKSPINGTSLILVRGCS